MPRWPRSPLPAHLADPGHGDEPRVHHDFTLDGDGGHGPGSVRVGDAGGGGHGRGPDEHIGALAVGLGQVLERPRCFFLGPREVEGPARPARAPTVEFTSHRQKYNTKFH